MGTGWWGVDTLIDLGVGGILKERKKEEKWTFVLRIKV